MNDPTEVPLVNGLAVGPMMHLHGPICIETGIGYLSHSHYGTHVFYTFGSTIVLRGFTIAVYYDYQPHIKDEIINFFGIGIGWAFKPNIDFKH